MRDDQSWRAQCSRVQRSSISGSLIDETCCQRTRLCALKGDREPMVVLVKPSPVACRCVRAWGSEEVCGVQRLVSQQMLERVGD